MIQLVFEYFTLSNQYWRGAHHIKKGQRPGELRPRVGWKRSVCLIFCVKLHVWMFSFNDAAPYFQKFTIINMQTLKSKKGLQANALPGNRVYFVVFGASVRSSKIARMTSKWNCDGTSAPETFYTSWSEVALELRISWRVTRESFFVVFDTFALAKSLRWPWNAILMALPLLELFTYHKTKWP